MSQPPLVLDYPSANASVMQPLMRVAAIAMVVWGTLHGLKSVGDAIWILSTQDDTPLSYKSPLVLGVLGNGFLVWAARLLSKRDIRAMQAVHWAVGFLIVEIVAGAWFWAETYFAYSNWSAGFTFTVEWAVETLTWFILYGSPLIVLISLLFAARSETVRAYLNADRG